MIVIRVTSVITSLVRTMQEAGFYLAPQFYRQILRDHGEYIGENS